jgi:hypothetical protein
MLPSTSLTVDDIIVILRARVWRLLASVAIVTAASAAIAMWLPNRYRSETLILVVPQRIPETYVKSTVTARLEDRLQSITQQILSRTRLERIIEDFHLYAAKRRAGVVMESIVDDMRKDIDVKVVKGNAFRVAYLGDDAKTVMEVTNRLASLFVEENLHDREVLAEDTNAFLGAQVAEARRRLIDHEKTLEAYRQRYAGELPSQLGSNVQALQNVQVQMQAVVESINRDRDRRLLRTVASTTSSANASATNRRTSPICAVCGTSRCARSCSSAAATTSWPSASARSSGSCRSSKRWTSRARFAPPPIRSSSPQARSRRRISN